MADKYFAKFLKGISSELKDIKPSAIVAEKSSISEETEIEKIARYLSTSQKIDDSIPSKNAGLIQTSTKADNTPAAPENIEAQRWNDPLVPLNQDFVTRKEMNEHYNLFLNRIQQQMSTIGGGGEVRFSRLDDVNASTFEPNKYLTYDPSTRKFVFDSISVGEGIELDNDQNILLSFATGSTLGGIRLGPGVILNQNYQIIIDSEGLDFSFGDFAASGNKLSVINDNQDAVIVTNGTGAIRAVGEFYIHPTNGNIEDYSTEPYLFGVGADGQVKIFVPTPDNTSGAIEVIGSLSGVTQTPVNTGVMLHITGQNSDPARLYVDGIGGYSGWVGRRLNGTSESPTQVLAGDEVMRLAANAIRAEGWSGIGSSNIRFISTDDQTVATQGMKIDFYSTPQGAPTSDIEKVMTVEGGIGVTATKFVGPLTGNADTADTATNLAAASNILAGTISVDPTVVNRSTTSIQTFTLTGLTTNHKIVVTPGGSLGHGIIIGAAWASAPNTISIEFHNYLGNQDIDLPAKTIQYFAWI
jgi:hypothetical protein